MYHQASLRGRWRSWRRNGRCCPPHAVRPGRAVSSVKTHPHHSTLSGCDVMGCSLRDWEERGLPAIECRPVSACTVLLLRGTQSGCAVFLSVSHSHHKTSQSEDLFSEWEERKKSKAERCRCACHPLQTHIVQTFPCILVSAYL